MRSALHGYLTLVMLFFVQDSPSGLLSSAYAKSVIAASAHAPIRDWATSRSTHAGVEPWQCGTSKKYHQIPTRASATASTHFHDITRAGQDINGGFQ